MTPDELDAMHQRNEARSARIDALVAIGKRRRLTVVERREAMEALRDMTAEVAALEVATADLERRRDDLTSMATYLNRYAAMGDPRRVDP